MDNKARDRSFDRLAILVLSIEWVFFGSMHFSFIEETVAQIPACFPGTFNHHIAVLTGIAEVATGVLILLPPLRKYAAMASVALLVLLIPAMYKILSEPSSVGQMSGFATAFRVIQIGRAHV